jgi:hypothetical protein
MGSARERVHRGNERLAPLSEAKMVHHFDHRFGTYEGQTDAQRTREVAEPMTRRTGIRVATIPYLLSRPPRSKLAEGPGYRGGSSLAMSPAAPSCELSLLRSFPAQPLDTSSRSCSHAKPGGRRFVRECVATRWTRAPESWGLSLAYFILTACCLHPPTPCRSLGSEFDLLDWLLPRASNSSSRRGTLRPSQAM